PWPMDDRGCQCQFLLHAMRIIRDKGFWPVRQLHEVEQLIRASLRRRKIQSIHAPDELQIFRARKPFEKAHAFGYNSNLSFHFDGMRGEVQPKKLHAS